MEWQENPFNSNLLNRVWDLFPRFVVWEIWKERNNRIFENKQRLKEEVYLILETHLKDALKLMHGKTMISKLMEWREIF